MNAQPLTLADHLAWGLASSSTGEADADHLVDQIQDDRLDEPDLRQIEDALQRLPKAVYATRSIRRLEKVLTQALEALEACDNCGFQLCRCVRVDVDHVIIRQADWLET